MDLRETIEREIEELEILAGRAARSENEEDKIALGLFRALIRQRMERLERLGLPAL